MVIDTHCHFNHERFAEDMPAALARAIDAGVSAMIVVGYDIRSSEQAVDLAQEYAPYLFATVGVHPHDSKDWSTSAADRLKELVSHPRVVAIGEIGLDFHHNFSSPTDQYIAFQEQLNLAREVGLPIVIHCREAYTETLELLRGEDCVNGGVMHCWAGSEAQAMQTVALGLVLGVGGTITFKNAEEVRGSAREVPLESLLLETDSPFLAPMPHRGKRNEPAFVQLAAQKLAEIRELSVEEIARVTSENALRTFPRLSQGV